MRNFKLLLLIFSCTNFFHLVSNAQEPLNTQIDKYSIARNPALVGLNSTDLQFSFSYQLQDKKLLLPYQSLQSEMISSYHISNDGFSIGALIKYAVAGSNHLKTAQFLPVLNFHKSLSDVQTSYLSFAFCTGVYKTQFDINTLPNIHEFNPSPFSLGSTDLYLVKPNSSTYLDFSTGISFYTDLNPCFSIHFGAGLIHFSQNIIKQNAALPKLNRTWVLNSGLNWKGQNISVALLADLRMNISESTLYTAAFIGLPVWKNPFGNTIELKLGSYYNSTGFISPSLSINLPYFSFGLSSEWYIGSIYQNPLLSNAIESCISIGINNHQRTNESEKMRCKF